jgi:hypothetical protein
MVSVVAPEEVEVGAKLAVIPAGTLTAENEISPEKPFSGLIDTEDWFPVPKAIVWFDGFTASVNDAGAAPAQLRTAL